MEGDALSAAIVQVDPILGHFACFDGGGGTIGRLENDGFLGRGRNADVEGNFASVHPVVDVDVRWPRKRARNEARHLLLRVEGRVLGYLEDGVADAVMTTTFHAVIVPAMERMIAESVLGDGAGGGATVSGWHERNAEAVSQRRPKRPRVDVEVERR